MTRESEHLALLESRLARAVADVLEATRVAAFDPFLAAGGAVGAAVCLVGEPAPRLAAVAEEGLALVGPLAEGLAAGLLPYLAAPGDVVAAGDPRLGLAPGEIAMVRGAYLDGRLVAVAISLALHDPLSTSLVVTPLRLVAAGEPDRTLLALLSANARRPGSLAGDLLAQAAGLAPAVCALERLAAAGGFAEGAARLAAATGAAARAALRGVAAPARGPAAQAGAATVAEPDEAPAPRLRLTVVPEAAGGITLDFGGSDLYRPGAPALPAPRAAALARLAVAQALPEVRLDSGLLAAVGVRIPAGSLLDPGLPPESGPLEPRRGGAAEADDLLAQRLVDLTHRALARLVPARALAGHGDGGTIVIEAPDRPGRPGWRCRLPIGAGAGASVGADGLPNVPPLAADAPAPSIEAIEGAYPVRVVRYALREGSAGAGRYRGGAGVEIEVELLPEARAAGAVCTWLGPAGVAPCGILGGRAGAAGEATATGRGIAVRTAGGGGYGNPYERSIRLVAEDVAAGLVHPDEARRAYGVAFRPAPRPPDGGGEPPPGRDRPAAVGGERSGRPPDAAGDGEPVAWEVDEERTYRIRNYFFVNLAVEEL